MKLTDKLDILMEEKDIKNIRELSQLSGIPYMTIRNFWVKGADNVKLSTLLKLKRFFGVTLDYLVDDDEEGMG